MEPKILSLSVRPEKLPRFFLVGGLVVMSLLFTLDLVVTYWAKVPLETIRALTNMAKEDSVGAWVSWVVALFVAGTAFAIYLRGRSRGWLGITFLFSYLAMDDGAKIHERVGSGLRDALAPSGALSWFPSYPWQLVFVPIFGTAALLMLLFLWKDMKEWKLRLGILAALGCYALAVLLDYMEGVRNFYNVLGWATGFSGAFVNHFGRVAEEFLELTGTTLFLLTFLSRFFRSLEGIEIRLERSVLSKEYRSVPATDLQRESGLFQQYSAKIPSPESTGFEEGERASKLAG